jgi:hypothetical protein
MMFTITGRFQGQPIELTWNGGQVSGTPADAVQEVRSQADGTILISGMVWEGNLLEEAPSA